MSTVNLQRALENARSLKRGPSLTEVLTACEQDGVPVIRHPERPAVTFDADEGRFVDLCCLACREDVRAHLVVATPVRMYIAAVGCPECGDEIVQYDVLSGRRA